jgi:glutathione S-transferase
VANLTSFYFLFQWQHHRNTPMYQLRYFPAHANAAPHMVLEELGAKCELLLVDRTKDTQKSREYLKINPNGRIPTLVDNNLVLSEAAAIVLRRAYEREGITDEIC